MDRFENKSLFLNHETYELKRLLTDKNKLYQHNQYSEKVKVINKHCFSTAFSTLLQH